MTRNVHEKGDSWGFMWLVIITHRILPWGEITPDLGWGELRHLIMKPFAPTPRAASVMFNLWIHVLNAAYCSWICSKATSVTALLENLATIANISQHYSAYLQRNDLFPCHMKMQDVIISYEWCVQWVETIGMERVGMYIYISWLGRYTDNYELAFLNFIERLFIS